MDMVHGGAHRYKALCIFVYGIVALLLVCAGCGGSEDLGGGDNGSGSSSSSGVRLPSMMGQLGEGYATPASGRSLIKGAGDATVSEVWAVPVLEGQTNIMDGVPFLHKLVSTLDSNNRFAFPLADFQNKLINSQPVQDWVLLLVNTAATNTMSERTAVIVGMVGVPAESDSTNVLFGFPLGAVATNADLNVGVVQRSGERALSLSNLTQLAPLSSLLSGLQEKAVTDQLLAHVKNGYVNEAIGLNPVFHFQGADYSLLGNSSRDPATEISYSGVTFSFPTYDGSSFPGSGDLGLYLPGQITYRTYSLNQDTFVVLDSPVVEGSLLGNTLFQVDGDVARINVYFSEPLPGGWFELDRDGSRLAHFDLAALSPFQGGDRTKILAYVPIPVISTDGSDNITDIQVKWYQYRSGSYQEVTDLSTLYARLAGQPDAELTANGQNSAVGSGDHDYTIVLMKLGGETSALQRFEFRMQGTVNSGAPTGSWRYATLGLDLVRKLVVSYKLGRVGFSFVWDRR